ncbi:hypothetical protein LCGC14_0935360 [marine sediment metagenome]|uniref:Uncharacterized protein n=1 Tax=marine sediment metagenome TaxID=412755 RepID=A0A0F9NLR6_9ZZZZ
MIHKHRFTKRVWLQGYPHVQCYCSMTKAVPLGILGHPEWPTLLEAYNA